MWPNLANRPPKSMRTRGKEVREGRRSKGTNLADSDAVADGRAEPQTRRYDGNRGGVKTTAVRSWISEPDAA